MKANTLESDYKALLEYARVKIAYLKITVTPDDLINDVFIKIHGMDYNFDEFKKEINNCALFEKYNTAKHLEINTSGSIITGKYHDEKIGQFLCSKCKQLKDASEYRLHIRKSGRVEQKTECKPCESERTMLRNKELFGVMWNKKQVQSRRGENRIFWNEYLKSRYANQRAELADEYIIMLLRGKYKRDFLLSNKQLIEEKRNEVRAKFIKKYKNKNEVVKSDLPCVLFSGVQVWKGSVAY